jgi:hypothetical protein
MALETLLTHDFQIQFDLAEYTQQEQPAIQRRADILESACETDYDTLCGWFGKAVGAGLGPSNRVIVTVTKNIRGASNTGYSTHHPQITINPELGSADDVFLGLFVAELSEIMMSYTGLWDPANSAGEGLSLVAAQLLHPQFGTGFVNAWLAADPTTDPSAAVADDAFRKDWVTQNFTGGPLKAGGNVNGDQDTYSYGCAMLFLSYLKDQLGHPVPQIVQAGAGTLDATYRKLTNGRTDGFWAFKALLAAHFAPGQQSSTDDPFPLEPVPVVANLAPGAASSGNTTTTVAVDTEGRIFYSWWDLGQACLTFGELEGDGRTGAAPAAALVGPDHNYLFVIVKGLGSKARLWGNQGVLGKPMVGWGTL